jgi:hypothetical protein
MSDLIVSVSHRLSQGEALRRVHAEIVRIRTHYSGKYSDLRESWVGYVGAFEVSCMGQKASGTVAANRSDVTVEVTLPFAALLIKPRIESGIRDALKSLLA